MARWKAKTVIIAFLILVCLFVGFCVTLHSVLNHLLWRLQTETGVTQYSEASASDLEMAFYLQVAKQHLDDTEAHPPLAYQSILQTNQY